MQRNSTKVIIRESRGRRIVEQSHVRLLSVGFFFVLCFSSIAVRMIEVAVIKNPQALTVTVFDPENGDEGEQVRLSSRDDALSRGDIVDRNGVLLATGLATVSAFVNTKEVKNPSDTAHRLAQLLSMDENLLSSRLKSGKSFVWIKRDLTPKQQQQVNNLGIPGIYFQAEEKRVYPYGNLFSHVLGYVGVDNKGLSGIERYFDGRLREPTLNRDPVALSLDVRLQEILRSEMSESVNEFNAIGATGVIMDIKSGDLLSMVSLPDFDPHKPAKATDAQKFNRAALGTYEQGSTFKTFTMAMGLEAGVATMKSSYDATNPLKIATFTINDAHGKKRRLSTPEIYAYSSNIGTAKMALDVGTKRQKEFMEKFGMFKPVDIELPEKGATQYPADWKEINTVTISYGHGISVTPLHLVQGIATIAGGGTQARLTLLKDGNKNKAEPARVVSEQTSENVRRLMRLAVDHGTGGKADVAGYRVGGKTGTAEKNAGGKYNADAKITSFISVFPVDDPKYLVLVMIDEPKGNKSTYGFATGGMIAAPVVGKVIARMGPLLGIKPSYDVPGDDAEKFWVDNEKGDKQERPRRQAAYAGTMMDKRYVSEAVY